MDKSIYEIPQNKGLIGVGILVGCQEYCFLTLVTVPDRYQHDICCIYQVEIGADVEMTEVWSIAIFMIFFSYSQHNQILNRLSINA